MGSQVRILQVFAQMNVGGAETMVMNLYRNIDRTKVQFDFIVHTEDECAYDREIKLLGGNIFRIPRYTGKNHLKYKKAWHKFFEEHLEYKIIHGHVRSTASIYLNIAKKYGLITIAHSHSTSSGSGISSIVKNIMQYPIRFTADYLFACSKPAGEWLFGKKACTKENFFVLKNAIDSQKYIFNEKIRIEQREKNHVVNKYVIGHIGRFIPAKNHNFLIDIFKVEHDKNKNSVLMLIGDGDLRKIIQKKVNDLGLSDSVIFTGVRSDIPKLLQAIDVFVFPSLYEGLPIAVIEAQATGLRSIIADTVPGEAHITGLTDIMSLNDSKENWANKILEYNDGYKRNNTYEQIKDNGYEIKETTCWLQEFYLGLM